MKLEKDIHSTHLANQIHESLEIIYSDSNPFLMRMKEYYELIDFMVSQNLSENVLEEYFLDSEVQIILSSMQQKWLHLEHKLEEFLYKSFILRETPFGKAKPFWLKAREQVIESYENLAENEINSCNITPAAHICHVGIGKVPLSPLYLHKFSKGCKVTGLERLPALHAAANLLIDHFCKNAPNEFNRKQIGTKEIDGLDFSYWNCDIIIFSSTISNKLEIYHKIQSSISKPAILLDREYHGLGRYFAPPSPLGKLFPRLSTSFQTGIIRSTPYKILPKKS